MIEAITPWALLPYSSEAERYVLGAMLRDNRVIDDVLQIVGRGDFYRDAHQRIFDVIVSLREAGQPADVVSVAEALRARGQLADGGGVAYVAELPDAAPSPASAEHYAAIVSEKAWRRRTIFALGELQAEASNLSTPTDLLVEQIGQRAFDLAERGVADDERQAAEVMKEVFDRIDARSGGGDAGCVPTGFAGLDAVLGGLHPGELVVIAARPSIGKTGVAVALALNVAVEQRRPVLFVSLEQSSVELGERLACSVAGVDSQRARLGRLSAADAEALSRAGAQIRGAPLTFSDNAEQSLQRIASRARRARRRGKLDLLLIDYLQLIKPENRRDPRHEQVAQLSRGLKRLARHLGVPVVTLAQLNRESEARTDGRPRLSDLRESGGIEADADTVMLLHRPDGKSERPAAAGVLEVIIAKQRNGPIGTAQLHYDRERHRLIDADSRGFDG